MHQLLSVLFATLWAASSWAATDDYRFPFKDPLLATVIGTPAEHRAAIDYDIPRKERDLVVFPDRKVPSIAPRPSYRYAISRQDGAAPLIFVIAGTGSSHRSAKMKLLEAVLYQAGYHVVSLSSPTYANFIITASSTHMPGKTRDDAADLYRVMAAIWAKHKDRVEATGFHMAGYSLGGTQAAFVAELDKSRREFGFDKVLMINPAVNLYNSVGILDRMLDDNVPGPVAPDFNTFLDRAMQRFSDVYSRNDQLDFNDEFLYRVYQENIAQGREVSADELKVLIGAAFRISSANMITTADFAAQRGFIIPKNHQFRVSESTTGYFKVAGRTSFVDYIEKMYLPYFREQDPAATREGLIRGSSLNSIESFLRESDNIAVVHNADDIILAPGEIDYLRNVFGDRAKIYPDGGHCGNIAHRDNVAFMIDFFRNQGE